MDSIWQPTASLENLRRRSAILAEIRSFFSARNVLEVETPILCQSTATDPPISSFATCYRSVHQTPGQTFYLQTSPEFPMKRLLAANIGAIYQISKAFRNGESGRHHNPEFTLLEWYRPGFDHFQLMDEIVDLLKVILNIKAAEKYSYEEIFEKYLQINPICCDVTSLIHIAEKHDISVIGIDKNNRDDWLNLIMTHLIEPKLIQPTFIYDYPSSQAALAKLKNDNPKVAERFELYINGLELANGYHELCDAKEQYQRFKNDNQMRNELGLEEIPIDYRLLSALNHHFPSCAGVALGLDRLVMLATGATSIAEVISFSLEYA